MNRQATFHIRWLGHAAFHLITEAGTHIYLDPWIVGNPACPIGLESIDRADIVCVSHGHFDHFGNSFDLVRRLGGKLICSPEMAWYADKRGIQREKASLPLDVGGSVREKDVEITMTQAIHLAELYGEEWSSDHEFRPGGGACGFVLRSAAGTCVYFAGDTALFSDMKLIAELYEPQVALLPIGGKFTMGPREAAIAAEYLRAQVVIPMHVNTYPVAAAGHGGIRCHDSTSGAQRHGGCHAAGPDHCPAAWGTEPVIR